MTDREEWLKKHTFHCPDIASRITPQQCEANRNTPRLTGLTACRKCTAWEERIKGVGMALSGNVTIDTINVLRRHNKLSDAAKELKLTGAGLTYRIQHNDEIMKVAVERGLYIPRTTKRSSKKGQFDKKADLPIREDKHPFPSNEIEKQEEQEAPPDPTQEEAAKPAANYSENIPKEQTPHTPPQDIKITIEITCGIDRLPGVLKALG